MKRTIKITEQQYTRLHENLIYEVSADKVMGAAKKMWQDKIGGDDQMGNPRAKKMLTDYASKLIGLELCGGNINSAHVDLISSDSGQAFELLFTIVLSRDSLIMNRFMAFYYNFSRDKIMLGSSLHDTLTPIDEFTETNLSKFDARQLSKVAQHFNPDTMYLNYTKTIPYNS